jgi:hypothetical protein
MKKIVSLITTAAMLALATPASANPMLDPRWGNDSNVFSPYFGQHQINSRTVVIRDRRNRGINTGEAIAIIGGVAVLSTIINNNNRRRSNETVIVDRQVRRGPQNCQDIIRYDYYGNPYVVSRRCW